MKKVSINKSSRKGKKLVALFEETDNKGKVKKKTIHFGAEGMSDYTINKDPKRKARYLKRHKVNENWNNPLTAGALSRWILWNKPSLNDSIKDFKKRFKFS